MKTTSWSLFTYPVMDIKAAEALLNRRAAEGWTLDRVYLGAFARFVPADTRSAWCVDWSRPGYSERPDYLALCADAGWTLVQKVGAFNLYKAPIGTPPIQTDPALVRRQFFRRELLPSLIAALVVVLFFVLLGPTLGLRTTLPPNLLTSNRELLVVALLLYMIVFSFLTVGWGLRFWLRTPPTVPNLRLARVKSLCGTLFHLCWLFCLILIPLSRAVEAEQPAPVWEPQTVADLPLLTLEDLGLEKDLVPEFRRRSSILASSLELMEYAGDASLTQERWDCRFDWVADQITADVLTTHAWFTPPIPADLGFDQSWTYAGGDGFHALLLRQGNTVVHLYGSPDLTTPDRLGLLSDALELTDES